MELVGEGGRGGQRASVVHGKPGRISSLQRFLDHVQSRPDVWVCRRIDIARHWKATHPFDADTAFVWT